MKITTIIERRLDFVIKLSDLFDRREKLQFLGVLIVVIVMALFQVLGIVSIFPFVSLIMNPEVVYKNQWLHQLFNFFGFTSTRSFLVFAGFGVLGIVVFGNLVSVFAIWLKLRFAWRKNHRMSSTLLKKYLSMPYVYFLNQYSADLAKNVVSEVAQLTQGFLLPLFSLITGVVVSLFIIVVLLYVNPLVTFIAVTVLLSQYLLVYFKLRGKFKLKGKERLAESRERSKALGDVLRGIKAVKFWGREEYFLKRFSKHSKKLSNIQSWNAVIKQVSKYIMEITAFGAVLGFVILLLFSEQDVRQIIPLVGFFALAGYRLLPALQRIFGSLGEFQFSKVALDKIHKEMNMGGAGAEDMSFDRELLQPMPFNKSLKLEDMSFSYPGTGVLVLKGINLEIKKNTSVAIVGPTGCGKSTLVDIILGLLTPSREVMKVDDTEVNKENIKNWQRNLGYVPQQIYLLNDTAARNIAFGLPDDEIDISQVKRVAKIANIHDFIEKELSNGYDSLIRERGVNLSGGQRQRIGIARALYNDPEVLVFDEATSSLDRVTERAVLEAMGEISKLKTLIIIAHRITTVKNCDLIYLMNKGKIEAKGTYDELMKSNVQFRAMEGDVT